MTKTLKEVDDRLKEILDLIDNGNAITKELKAEFNDLLDEANKLTPPDIKVDGLIHTLTNMPLAKTDPIGHKLVIDALVKSHISEVVSDAISNGDDMRNTFMSLMEKRDLNLISRVINVQFPQYKELLEKLLVLK